MNKNQNYFGITYESSTKAIEAFKQCQKVDPNGELIIETPINTVHCNFGNVNAYTNETGTICINVEEYGEITRGIGEDAQPVKHGRWIDCTFYDPCEKSWEQNYEFKCSNCGHMIYNKPNDDNQYCGHCSARMDGEKK